MRTRSGKSFLLTAVYLWALIHKMKVRAAAPTGIAAANILVEGTDVAACTIHALFQFDASLQTKLDFSKLDNKDVAKMLETTLLMLDEVSMLDTVVWHKIVEVLSIAQQTRRPNVQQKDEIGEVHLLLFGDFKLLC